MAELLHDDTDKEILRYKEAQDIKQYSGVTIDTLRGGKIIHDPIKNVEAAYVDLPSGGTVRIGERPVTPAQAVETDMAAQAQEGVVAATSASPVQPNGRPLIESIIGGENGPQLEDYLAAGYTEDEVLQFQQWDATQTEQQMIARGDLFPNTLDQAQLDQLSQIPGAEMVQERAPGLRGNMQDMIYNALDPNREPSGPVGEMFSSALRMIVPDSANLDAGDLRFWSNLLTDFADVTAPGVGGSITVDEGAREFNYGSNLLADGIAEGDMGKIETGLISSVIGAGITTLGVAEMVPLVGELAGSGADALRKLQPATKNLLADAIGASRALSQGDKELLGEIFQTRGTPRSLGAAGVADQGANLSIQPASEAPSVAGLAPEYRVTVGGFEQRPGRAVVPTMLTPANRETVIQNMDMIAEEFPDPLASQEAYAGMVARTRNEAEVPAPPTWMIENANNTESWAKWFGGITPDQIRGADEGLAVQRQFQQAYESGADARLTGQLMFWSIMSRMLSAFPHESGYLELGRAANPYIQIALRGEWTDETTKAWRDMVSSTIPLDSPGRSATSNANAFGETFLRKMSVLDENGVSALERLHNMIADPNMSSAQIRREYYGLASQTGIANKILSFALLVSGRNDVVVLDRIQINRMWAGGRKVYDDIMTQFEGAQGLVQYEALERSLAARIPELYASVGRAGEGSVGRYHWESWVLSSGQVVSHPTLEAVVRTGTPDVARNIPPTAGVPVAEGRFHQKYSGVQYEQMPDGTSRYIYRTSDGEPYQFTKAALDAMFAEVFKKRSGVLPTDFPGVKAFEGGSIPWFEYKGVDRGKLDEYIRQAGTAVQQ